LVASKYKALFERPSIFNPYQLGFNGVIARHFSLGDIRFSPTVQYMGVSSVSSMSHSFRPGIVTQIHDKYTLGFNAQTPDLKSDRIPLFFRYQVQAGVEFWDNLLIRTQVGFRTSEYFDDPIVGAGVSWFIGEDLLNNDSSK
jgi:hypothetical protein